jgi:hypothetical protein
MPVDKFGKFKSNTSTGKYNNYNKSSILQQPIGYKITADGNLNMENRQLNNIGLPTNDNDAVPLHMLETQITSSSEAVVDLMNKLIRSQTDLYDLIVKQEGKIRDVINERCNGLEKELKSEFHSEIASIRRDVESLKSQLLNSEENSSVKRKQIDPQPPLPTLNPEIKFYRSAFD